MSQDKISKIVYWTTTVFVAANYAFAGYVYITLSKDVADGMSHLGYPLYFIVMLGIWKILGAVAISVPRFTRLKEWAYAGMFFNLTSAAISNAIVGNTIGEIVTPLILLVVASISWALRPATRTLSQR